MARRRAKHLGDSASLRSGMPWLPPAPARPRPPLAMPDPPSSSSSSSSPNIVIDEPFVVPRPTSAPRSPRAPRSPLADSPEGVAIRMEADTLRTVASHWRYPDGAQRRVSQEDATGTYRRIRETVRDDIIDGARRVREYAEDGDLDHARSMLNAMRQRWSSWLTQVQGMTEYDPVVDATWADNAATAFDEFGAGLAAVPGNVVAAVVTSNLAAGAGVALVAFLVLSNMKKRRA